MDTLADTAARSGLARLNGRAIGEPGELMYRIVTSNPRRTMYAGRADLSIWNLRQDEESGRAAAGAATLPGQDCDDEGGLR
jgi:hypothetical protein